VTRLVFDARFIDHTGQGQPVDKDLHVDFCVGDKVVLTRHLGVDPYQHISQIGDAQGTTYMTVVDGATIGVGEVTAHWYANRCGVKVQPYPLSESLYNQPNDGSSPEELEKWIKAQLGWPAVEVELPPEAYHAIWQETLDLYSRWVPIEKSIFFNVESGKMNYHFPQMPPEGPYDVQFVKKAGIPFLSSFIFGREFPMMQMFSFEEYAMTTSYWEMMRRMIGHEPEFTWEEPTRSLYINTGTLNMQYPGAAQTPSVPLTPQFGTHYAMARYMDRRKINEIRSDHLDWVRRYALARAMVILARIRGKYMGAVPAPGGKFQTDAMWLWQSGERDMKELREELKNMAIKVPPILG
jgi:hypothetical protein